MSFVAIPRIIVRSGPAVSRSRLHIPQDLNLHTLAYFVLWEKFHLIVSRSPSRRRRLSSSTAPFDAASDTFDKALLVLTVFAAIAQRTAFAAPRSAIILLCVSDRPML